MSPTLDAFLRSWPHAPWLTATLLLTGGIYARGWKTLQRRDPRRWHVGQFAAFISGLAIIFVALASPIEPFASFFLSVHMLQHLLLMMVAPPLLWLGAPLMPLVRGLPKPVRTYWVVPLLRGRPMRQLFARLTYPFVAWPLFVATTWLWHTPRAYELGLSQEHWHFVQHICFIASALVFWYPVVRPYPNRPRWPRWILVPYLLLADVQNTVLAAGLTFSPDVLYSHYARVPRLAGVTPLDDQAAAGVLMWVPGSIAFLLPLVLIGVTYLFGSEGETRRRRVDIDQKLNDKRLPLLPIIDPRYAIQLPSRFDLARIAGIRRFVRWRHSRRLLQLIMAIAAAMVIYDGLYGPPLTPINLAGVLPWIHWRGLLILGLLVAGNVFCLACPFTLPRAVARRWLPSARPWPQRLRSKWLAAGLVALFLWSYEAFALWNSPWVTAWIVVGYFVAAFVVDSYFSGAAFCKYVCPIGQFNFVQSLVSPLEVSVRQPAACAACYTRECIRGSETSTGCEMHLFQPRKKGNLDCTFCLSCVHACPHDNVGIFGRIPGQTLWSDPLRSGVGRFSRRPDLAALALVLVFGAFANAAGMIAPVVQWQDRLSRQLGDPPRVLLTTAFYLLTIIALPLLAVRIAAAVSRSWGSIHDAWPIVAARYAMALIPIGFAMWFAHYSFHLLTSFETIIPALQRFANDIGWSGWGEPLWHCACCRPAANWILNLEILTLDVGLLLSLYTGFRIAESSQISTARALKVFGPWAILMALLFAWGVWIVFQPMEMRGTGLVIG
jgi:cytochrome c oxidase assembly factor CtaG/polyferredoxin